MIANLDRRFFSLRSWLGARRSARELGIGRSDLVLDVGSGQNPHPRANVLCDLFPADNTERASHGGLRVDRPLLVSDAANTPFPDKAFDFVFCSHLLEHVEDPGSLLDELQRIGQGGFIETPGKTYEKLYGWTFHRWFVSVENDRLRIEAKRRPIFDDDLHEWFGRELERPTFWRAFIPRLRERGLLTTHVWRGEIAYEVIGTADSGGEPFTGAERSDVSDPSEEHSPGSETTAQRIKGGIDSLWRRHSDARVPEVLNSLRCPQCRNEMRLGGSGATCVSCENSVTILGSAQSH